MNEFDIKIGLSLVYYLVDFLEHRRIFQRNSKQKQYTESC